ncbi:MAG: hypothetical protein EON48_09565, partial [Acetobacteraceae bacterium]
MKPPVNDLPKRDAGLGEGPLAQLNDPPRLGLEVGGVGLSLVWVILILVYVLVTPPGSDAQTLGLVMTLLMVFLPIALIWAVVITLRSIRELRAEAKRLQATVDAMRSSYVQAQAHGGLKPSVEQRLDEIAASTKEAQTVLATFNSRRDVALSVPSADRKAVLVTPRPEPAAEEPTLALGTPVEDFRPPLSVVDFIRALQFPETPEDREGFRALRLALEDRTSSKLIRAAQDVLTLLSQDGIYVDDLQPDLCHPELWRRFS